MDKETRILSDDPRRQDTMMFRKPGAEINSGQAEYQVKKYHIDYFPFYKAYDKSAKIDKIQREELLPAPKEEDVQETILKKNLRLLLGDIDDLGAI